MFTVKSDQLINSILAQTTQSSSNILPKWILSSYPQHPHTHTTHACHLKEVPEDTSLILSKVVLNMVKRACLKQFEFVAQSRQHPRPLSPGTLPHLARPLHHRGSLCLPHLNPCQHPDLNPRPCSPPCPRPLPCPPKGWGVVFFRRRSILHEYNSSLFIV